MKHFVPAPILAAALLLSGCSLGSSPDAGPAASPTATAVTPTATPAATPAAACRLPVAGGDAPTDGNAGHGARGHGGFVAFPAGSFSADTTSLSAYSLATRTWVPVPRAWMSPDGKSYAYPEYRQGGGPVTGIIHVVDIGTGSDRPLTVPSSSMPISWEAAGIYIARVVPNSGAPPAGLSLLDPHTGALRQIVPDGSWTLIADGFAFSADLDSTVAPPPGPTGPGAANRIRSLRLDTGAQSVVGTFPSTNVLLLGAQGSTPLLGLAGTADYTVKLGSQVLFSGPVTGQQPSGPAVVDGATVWFSGVGYIYRSVAGAPAERFPVPGGQLAVVAGACR